MADPAVSIERRRSEPAFVAQPPPPAKTGDKGR